ISATISANLVAGARRSVEILLQIRRQDFGCQAALSEDDQLELPLEKLRCDSPRLGDVRTPDAQLLVDDRRIHEEEALLPAGRTALLYELEWPLRQRFGKLSRICDGRR